MFKLATAIAWNAVASNSANQKLCWAFLCCMFYIKVSRESVNYKIIFYFYLRCGCWVHYFIYLYLWEAKKISSKTLVQFYSTGTYNKICNLTCTYLSSVVLKTARCIIGCAKWCLRCVYVQNISLLWFTNFLVNINVAYYHEAAHNNVSRILIYAPTKASDVALFLLSIAFGRRVKQ